MNRALAIMMAALLLLAPQPATAEWSGAKAARVDALIAQFLRPRDGAVVPPGLSLAVGVDGTLRMAKGFGEARDGTPASAGTVYHIGSLTKQFTAAAVLQAIAAGARAPLSGEPLSLDTPMRDVFEGVEQWSTSEVPPVTVRSLLTMTSNLPNFTKHPPREVDPWGAVTTPKLMAALKRLPPHGWPNTFEYSNTGYFLLARVIEAAQPPRDGERLSVRAYVQTNILQRIGLPHTAFVGDGPDDADTAAPHYRRKPAFTQPHWLDGSGDMASNVLDLFQWNRALIEGRVLDAAATRAMFSDGARVDPLTYYGMGWFITHDESRDTYFHSGSVPGYTSYSAIERSTGDGHWTTVILLTNSDGVTGLERLADEILYVVRSDTAADR